MDDSVSDESIDKVFAAIDTDGKGTITQGELTSAVNRRPSTAERRGSTKEGRGRQPAALTRGESSASMPAKLKRGESEGTREPAKEMRERAYQMPCNS